MRRNISCIGPAMLLLAALFQGDRKMLASSLEDRIHQPYREPLCPLLPALRNFTDEGVLGSVLSGAGPSVLMFLDPKAGPEKVKGKIENYLREKNMRAELLRMLAQFHGTRLVGHDFQSVQVGLQRDLGIDDDAFAPRQMDDEIRPKPPLIGK